MRNDIIINGNSIVGTCFAIYDFLENQCGCRWYDKFNVKIPKKAVLTIKDVNMQRAPSFIFRRIFTQARNWASGDPLGALRSKATYNSIPNPVMGRPADIHSMYLYTKDWPKDKLYLLSKNPDGRRNAQKGQLGPNTCVTHPEAVALFKQKLRYFINRDRADSKKYGYVAPILYNISINDCSSYFCYCDSCQAVVKKHGESGLLLHFINMLAKDIARDYPGVIIHTCAYSFTAPPPKTDIKAAPNVAVELAHNVGNYYAAIEDDTKGNFAEQVKNWGTRTNMLGIWDYWVFYWDTYPAPYHNVHQIKKDLMFYYTNGVRTLRIESEGADTTNFFALKYIPVVLLLGFVAYGLSIFTYIRAQKTLGAAKTSAYYSIAPFIGAFLAFAFLGEALSAQYVVALLVMIVGTLFIVYDTLVRSHTHEGSGLASCMSDVKKAFLKANVKNGFSIYGHEVRTEKAKVEKWLKSIGY